MVLCECGCGQETTVYRGKAKRFVHGHNRRDQHQTEEAKRQMAEAMLGNKHGLGRCPSEATRRKISGALKGHLVSEETRRKLSLANKGKPSPMKGKQHTEEAKRRMSEAGKARPGPMVGTHHTEEAKRKMSMAKKAAWVNGVYDNRKSNPRTVTYQGIQMRSMWEARLAQAFGRLGWAWEYEPRSFQYELDDGIHTYLPDFYVPHLDTYFDPHHPRWDRQLDKFDAVREQSGITLIVLGESLLTMYESIAKVVANASP